MSNLTLPSAHQIDDSVWFNLWSTSVPSDVVGIHFYAGKVKYDLQLNMLTSNEDGEATTRIYNVDSAFVSKIHPDQQKEN